MIHIFVKTKIIYQIDPDDALELHDEVRNANLPAARQVKYEVWELRHSHHYGEMTKLSETVYFAGISARNRFSIALSGIIRNKRPTHTGRCHMMSYNLLDL